MEEFGSPIITNDMVQSILLQLPPSGQSDALFQTDNNIDSPRSYDSLRIGNSNVFADSSISNKKQQLRYASEDNASHSSDNNTAVSNKSTLKGAGVRRRKRARYVGGGAKAVKVPENEEFPIGLERPIVEMLKPGKRKLNTLQMQKFKDATEALQQMHIHRLEPLTLYTDCQLYDLMASIAESWKNSGKTAWKKRIHKIKENARYRKQPRKNTLDNDELEEIAALQKKIKEREEWEKREKAKLEHEKNLKKQQKRKLLAKTKQSGN